ncbi:MAG: biotin transporter BioY [Lachnospira sp.]
MKKKITIYDITTCAIFTALMCILGPMSIPIGPVPISLTNLVIYLSVYILGFRNSTISCVVYLLLGAVGLPVFSAYSGGLEKLAGPTGGYLIGFIFIALIGGLCMKLSKANPVITGLGLIVGTAITYAFGTVWFIIQLKCSIEYALTVCVYPFIPFDLAKIVIATVLGLVVRKALKKASLLPSIGANA